MKCFDVCDIPLPESHCKERKNINGYPNGLFDFHPPSLALPPSVSNTTASSDVNLTDCPNVIDNEGLPSTSSHFATPPDNDLTDCPNVTDNEDPLPSTSSNFATPPGNDLTVDSLAPSKESSITGKVAAKCKKNYCKYCRTMQSKIGRHIASKHKDIPEVQLYLQTTDTDKKTQMKQRREICKLIINQSNKNYNENIVKGNELGKPIVVKKTKMEATIETHVTCSACGGLLSKKHFASHKKHCEKRQILLQMEPDLSIPEARVMGQELNDKYKILQNKVIDKMNSDDIKSVIVKDNLILEFGRRFLKSHMADHQRNYVSNKMRTLADLVIRMKQTDPQIKDMTSCVDPINFDLLCQVVKKWSKLDEESGICQVGSVPRRLNKSLKTCSQILWSEAIKNKGLSVEDQNKIRNKHERFMCLMETDWGMEINSAADKSLKVKKVLGEAKMPLEEDIVLFFKIITSEIENCISQLKEKRTRAYYDQLTQATLAYLIAFNCRRPGEVAYATIPNFEKLQSDNETSEESLGVFNVAALKNDVKVPVIVTKTALYAIMTLLEFRATFSIKGTLLFPNNKGRAYNGSDILFKFKSKMSLKNPEDFTANGMRHYWATVSQRNSEIKKHMPKFLGHTTLTHQRFYEMPLADIHLNVVGPLIRQQCLPTTSKTATEKESDLCLPSTSAGMHTSVDSSDEAEGLHSTRKRKCKRVSALSKTNNVDSDYTTDGDVDEEAEEDDIASSSLLVKKRKRWITPEKMELFNKLPHTVLGLKSAGRGEVKKAWQSSELIKKRHSLQMTRIEVSKYRTKKKKIPTPIKINLMKRISE